MNFTENRTPQRRQNEGGSFKGIQVKRTPFGKMTRVIIIKIKIIILNTKIRFFLLSLKKNNN